MLLLTAPNWAEITTAVGSAVAGGGLLLGGIGAWAGIRQLREAKRVRQFEILSEIGKRWDDDLLVESRARTLHLDNRQLADRIRELWRPKGQSDDPDVGDLYVLLRIPNFFEDVALMAEAGGLELEWVWRIFGDSAIQEWRYWEEAIDVLRDADDPGAYIEFQRLARDLENYDASRNLRPKRRLRPAWLRRR
jgi:hypothetical protein